MKWNRVLSEKGYVQRVVDTYEGRKFMILLGGKMEIQVKNNKFRFITKLTDGPDPLFYDFKDSYTTEFESQSFKQLSNDLKKRFKITHLDTLIDEKEFDQFENNIKNLVEYDVEMEKRIPEISFKKNRWDMFFQIGTYLPNENTKAKIEKILKDGKKVNYKLKLSFLRKRGGRFVEINTISKEDERMT